MKKIMIVAFSIVVSIGTLAQSKLNEAKLAIGTRQWEKAKTAIDEYLADPKNAAKAEGWYYKGAIYNTISKDAAFVKLCADCRLDAFNAFKKYQELDPSNKEMAPNQNDYLFDLYYTYFDIGANTFNNKVYDSSLYYFKRANDVGQYIASKKFTYNGTTIPELDTLLIMNMAKAANNLPDKEQGSSYFKMITDAGISTAEYRDVYQALAEYYAEKKDVASLKAIMEKATKLYPDYEYWPEIELGMIDEKDKVAKLAKYDELIKTNPRNYALHQNYAVELFNYLYAETLPADAPAKETRLIEVLKLAMALNNTVDANLLAEKVFYNQVYNTQDAMRAIKGTKPDDIKKKADLKAASMKKADEAIIYGEKTVALYKAMPTLKAGQKATYKNALNILESMYNYKGNTAKADECKKLAETIH